MYVELKTKRLLLRPVMFSDWEDVHDYASSTENTRYMTFMPNETVGETQDYLRKAEAQWQLEKPLVYDFAVTLESKVIGAVSVMIHPDGTQGEMGWIIHRDYWNKGYATEAANAVKEYAIRTLKLQRLIATCDARNIPSSRVMEKLFFRMESEYEGRFYPKTGEKSRERLYSIILSD